MRCVTRLVLTPMVSAGMCCYEGCDIAPTSCNVDGDYCQDQGRCSGECGAQWCGDPTPTPTPPTPTPPTPTPPTPTPPTPTPPTPTPPGTGAYCPAANDLVVTYGERVSLRNGGYTVEGNGGVATKTSFNLLGGYVEFDVDVSNVETGVNANLYAIAPITGGSGFVGDMYCDGAINDRPNCIELDFLESNGNCAAATTLHTVMGEGSSAPCNSWGCRAHWSYNGNTQFRMRVEYDYDGRQSIYQSGQSVSDFSPSPLGQDWDIIKSEMQSKGVVIYGSEWEGWVPEEWCGTAGCLECSSYSISNMVVSGSVVQGPEPSRCQSFANTTDISV